MEQRELLKGNTPTLVLTILNEGPQHTYAIGRILKERLGEDAPFQRGTLYPVMNALEKDGMVAGEWETGDGERPRRIYTLTDAGRAELARRIANWRRFSDAMNRLVGGLPGGEPHE